MMRPWMQWAAAGALALGVTGCGDSGTAPGPTPPAVTGGTTTAMSTTPSSAAVDLNLALPRAEIIGTVVNLPQWAQSELMRTARRPPIKVPTGCTNVAFHKPVTASGGVLNGLSLALVTDGDKEPNGNAVQLGPGLQWFQVDLQEKYAVYAIVSWRFHQNPRVFHSVVVQVSDDPAFARNVTTVFNNDVTNAAGFGVGNDREFLDRFDGQLIETKGVAARYVRLYSNGSTADDQNPMQEVEVYGLPAK